jgi:hypothetical protein
MDYRELQNPLPRPGAFTFQPANGINKGANRQQNFHQEMTA